jgi:hypothetical protein
MPICKKCRENKKGLDGKKASYFLFPGAILFTWLFGIPVGLTMVGFAIYSLVVHNPQNFICEDCFSKSCPECQKIFSSKNYCKDCKLVACPYCEHQQSYETKVSWPAAIGGFFILIIVILALLAGLMAAPWVVVVLYLFYLYYSSPRCQDCKERIPTSNF